MTKPIQKIKKLWEDKTGVSPIIAVILMVAITVVLAATIYVWVSGFGGETGTEKNTIAMNLLTQNNNDNYRTWQVADVEGTMLINDTTWQLLDYTDDTNSTGSFANISDNDGDWFISAGDTVRVTAPADGRYSFIVNFEGETVYTSGYKQF